VENKIKYKFKCWKGLAGPYTRQGKCLLYSALPTSPAGEAFYSNPVYWYFVTSRFLILLNSFALAKKDFSFLYGDGIHLTHKNGMGLKGDNIFASQLPLQGYAQRVFRPCHRPNNASPREAPKGILISKCINCSNRLSGEYYY
jgi:hypothetical protein